MPACDGFPTPAEASSNYDDHRAIACRLAMAHAVLSIFQDRLGPRNCDLAIKPTDSCSTWLRELYQGQGAPSSDSRD